MTSFMPSENESTLKGNNSSTPKGKHLLPLGANAYLLEWSHFQKGGKNYFVRVASLESVSILLKMSSGSI